MNHETKDICARLAHRHPTVVIETRVTPASIDTCSYALPNFITNVRGTLIRLVVDTLYHEISKVENPILYLLCSKPHNTRLVKRKENSTIYCYYWVDDN